MHKPCSVDRCAAPAKSYSPYCSGHRKALGRQGHPLQPAIRPRDLEPFQRLIAKRQASNADSPAWAILRTRWASIVNGAQGTLAVVQAGKAFVKVEAEAARLIRAVSDAAQPDMVIRTAMSVAMHLDHDPRRYLSDRAVLFQMARAVLRLAPGSMGRYWDHKARASRTVRRDVPPRVLEVIAVQLNEAFGGAGAQLAAIERSRVPPEEKERRALAEALEALQ